MAGVRRNRRLILVAALLLTVAVAAIVAVIVYQSGDLTYVDDSVDITLVPPAG